MFYTARGLSHHRATAASALRVTATRSLLYEVFSRTCCLNEWQVHGTYINLEQLYYARQQDSGGTSFVVADAFAHPYASASFHGVFDYVGLVGVLSHLFLFFSMLWYHQARNKVMSKSCFYPSVIKNTYIDKVKVNATFLRTLHMPTIMEKL